jgi:hypothetical protein
MDSKKCSPSDKDDPISIQDYLETEDCAPQSFVQTTDKNSTIDTLQEPGGEVTSSQVDPLCDDDTLIANQQDDKEAWHSHPCGIRHEDRQGCSAIYHSIVGRPLKCLNGIFKPCTWPTRKPRKYQRNRTDKGKSTQEGKELTQIQYYMNEHNSATGYLVTDQQLFRLRTSEKHGVKVGKVPKYRKWFKFTSDVKS